MNEFVRQFQEAINMFYGLPSYGVTLIACIVWGMALKANPKADNAKIPYWLMWIGALVQLGCSDWYGSKLPVNLFIVKAIVLGWIIGFFAPKIHERYIKPWETSIPIVGPLLARGNTKWFYKSLNANEPGLMEKMSLLDQEKRDKVNPNNQPKG